MSLISDKFHKKKLEENNINIKTKYIVGNKILERNSNNSHNDDITSGIICKKEYYKNNILKLTETNFDTRMEYTFISKELENKEHKCINCGMVSTIKDFINGCPYCRTLYNIDYQDKELGSKHHYDIVLRSNTYRIITAIIDLILSIIISYIYIKNTSRTFNNIDIIKVFVYGTILSTILYYFFYIIDAYIVLGPIKAYKTAQNKKQKDFWNRTQLDKKTIFNNLNYEIQKKYYNTSNIIDYDILDYDSFNLYQKNNKTFIKIISYIRLMYIKDNKIVSNYKKEHYILKKYDKETLKLENDTNMIKCPNCGSSIDATKESCTYCRTEINYLQEWILVENDD